MCYPCLTGLQCSGHFLLSSYIEYGTNGHTCNGRCQNRWIAHHRRRSAIMTSCCLESNCKGEAEGGVIGMVRLLLCRTGVFLGHRRGPVTIVTMAYHLCSASGVGTRSEEHTSELQSPLN